MSTGPKVPNTQRNAYKHGIYARRMTPEERATAATFPLGSLDEEILLTRTRLNRALDAEALAAGQPEMDEQLDVEGFGARSETRSKVRDYATIIDKLTNRVQSLEMARRELMKVNESEDDAAKQPIGKIIVEVVHARITHDDDRAAS